MSAPEKRGMIFAVVMNRNRNSRRHAKCFFLNLSAARFQRVFLIVASSYYLLAG